MCDNRSMHYDDPSVYQALALLDLDEDPLDYGILACTSPAAGKAKQNDDEFWTTSPCALKVYYPPLFSVSSIWTVGAFELNI